VTKEDRKIWVAILICAAIVVLLIVVLLVRHGPWRVATSVPSAQYSIELQAQHEAAPDSSMDNSVF
jgi:hypothetical protein